MEVIKEVFKSLTARWKEYFVIYPIGSTNEIQHCVSRFYYITYEIDSPIKNRFANFKRKYKSHKHYNLE